MCAGKQGVHGSTIDRCIRRVHAQLNEDARGHVPIGTKCVSTPREILALVASNNAAIAAAAEACDEMRMHQVPRLDFDMTLFDTVGPCGKRVAAPAPPELSTVPMLFEGEAGKRLLKASKGLKKKELQHQCRLRCVSDEGKVDALRARLRKFLTL